MNKLYCGIMGLVVGDALGVPFEFSRRDTFSVTDMVGYGTHYQPAGTWSDDSSMALATLDSFVQLGKLDLKHLMDQFVNWAEHDCFTAHGDAFDIGGTTMRAIEKYQKTGKPQSCGGSSFNDNGNR